MNRMRTLACIAFLFTCLLTACYEPVEGCLDPNGLNFSLDADRSCDGCCSYPTLSVRIVHNWMDADTSFTLRYTSDAYRDGGGNPFLIDRITYYLQDFSLVRSDGSSVGTTDTVLVSYLTDSGVYEDRYIPDDYLLINGSVSSALEVGTMAESGNFTQLRFVLGMDEFTDRVVPGSLSDNHPLSLLDSTMYDLDADRYLSNRLDLARSTAQGADDLLLAYGSELPVIPITVLIPGGYPLPPGFNMVVTLQVNYADWFQSITDIDSGSEADLLSQIVASLPNSFTLVDITANQQ